MKTRGLLRGCRSALVRGLSIEQLESRRLFALTPTGDEQELMQLVNRFRTDPTREFSRLISSASPIVSRDPILQADLDFAQVDGNKLRDELQTLPGQPPVAWNEAVRDFSLAHNAEMINRVPPAQFHSNSVERRQALLDAGVNLRFAQGELITSENVFGFGKSALHIFGSFVIDWQSGGPNGMASGRPHRVSVGHKDFEQAGMAISNFSGSNFGPKVNTSLLVNIQNPVAMVTGAIFEDRNKSGWYESGEGIGSVQYVFEGSVGKFMTTGYSTGGYAIALPAGTYTATATGGGMKYPQVMTNIVVGSVNVWKNFIYDPSVIPPDSLESNDTTAAATPLTGAKQTFTGLSIHVPSDTDYFRLVPLGTGMLKVDLQFTNANGNLDLQVLTASGGVVGSSATTGNIESVTASVLRGNTYYVRVLGSAGAINDSYSLTIDPPQAVPPIANTDRASLNGASSIIIDVLANDSDPDGNRINLVPQLASGSHAAFSITPQKTVQYTAVPRFSGVHRASYTVRDDQGLSSAPTEIAVFVIDYSAALPWKNSASAFDVNDDGVATPLDALLAINDLNQRQSRELPTTPGGAAGVFGFVDTSGDGFITPLDALIVINHLNGGNGEGEIKATAWATNDEALQQLMDDYNSPLETERRKLLDSSRLMRTRGQCTLTH